MAAIIKSTVNGIDKIGLSRDDLRSTAPWNVVTLDSVDTATTYAWNLVYTPEGSTATLSGDPLAKSPGTFTVDKEGPYLVRLIVNLGLATENTQYVRLRFLTVLGDLKLVASGEKIDAYGSIPVDQTPDGWANEQNFNVLSLLGLVQRVVTSGRILYVDPNAVGGVAPPDPVTGTVEGYGDYDKIQDAINAAVSAGASLTTPWVVAVRPGSFVEDLTFQPNVHVIGWAGNPQDSSTTVSVRTDIGFHRAASSSATHFTLLAGITLLNSGTNTEPVLRKDGPGRLYGFGLQVVQFGVSVGQGPALRVTEGNASLDNCDLTFSPTTASDRAAFIQDASSSSNVHFRNCRVSGPTGMHLSPGMDANVVTRVTDCDITSTVAGGIGVNTNAESLTLEYCRVRAPLGTPLSANPTGAAQTDSLGVTVRWTFLDGIIRFETAGAGVFPTTLDLGSVEYASLDFPTTAPTVLATTKSRSLFYDPTATGMTADNVQDAIDEVYALTSLVLTLDDAYDGGIPNSGSGRTIIADQGPVEIVDSATPSDPVPANNTDGILRVVGGVEVGAINKPEIHLDPNPFGNGPHIDMGWTAWANQAPFGSSATIMGKALGNPLYRNYNLRLQTESTDGGGIVARTILRAGDALANGIATPDAGSVYVQAGSGLSALTGAAGNIYIAPGDSQAGFAGSTFLVRPQAATPATLTAAAPFVGGVTGDIRIATNMGAVTVSIDAADNLAAVLLKFAATKHLTAVDVGGGVIQLISEAAGPNAEVFVLSADLGVDAALGGFIGQIPVDGTWPEFFALRVTAANELTMGSGGATGPMIYNSDTGKLTVPGVIDPTALILENSPPFAWESTHGTLWVSDGSGGTNLGDLYYIHEYGTPGGSPINLSAAAAASIEIRDEGTSIGTFSIIDFIGADVQAFGVGPVARVYIPPATFDSHWNTADGNNGDQSVTESISRTTAHIATPNGGEGTPFKTGGWAATNQDATTTSGVIATTPSTTTGFGGDSTMTVVMYDADGVTPLDSYTTPAITGDAVHTSPSTRIVVTITSFGPDAFRKKAKASAAVNVAGVFTDNGLDGGRYHIEVTHTPDSLTDGTGPYVYTQSDVFLDTNPTTPSISGAVTIAETITPTTKHLSGIEYYTTGSQFVATILGIDQLNRNTSRITANLVVTGTEYGLTTLNHSPFGTGSANFSGWTNDENTDGVNYQITTWAISAGSYRYIGPTANISTYPRDPWANGATIPSADASVMIDTYGTTSSNLVENFDDESRRQDSGYNGGTSPGNWVSTTTLVAGEALVFGGQMMVPNRSTYIRSDGADLPNADWTTYKPDAGGANPNYNALGAPVSHHRTIVDTTGLNRASFQMNFSGSFVSDATTDLAAGNLEIYVRRRASAGGGNTGPACPPLLLHGVTYNFATFDDGVTDGHIRESSSSGNTVNATFGGFSCETGFFIEVKIIDPSIKIDSYSVTFF